MLNLLVDHPHRLILKREYESEQEVQHNSKRELQV